MRRIFEHIPLLEVALVVVVALAALMLSSRPAPASSIAAGDCPTITYARAHPKPVTEVPRTLPCAGVAIMDGVDTRPTAVLLPVTRAAAHAPGVMSLDQMLAFLRRNDYTMSSPNVSQTSALLTYFTDPSTFPPDPGPDVIPGTHTTVIWNPIVDRLSWVFVATFAQPENVAVGGYCGKGCHAVAMAQHSIAVIDARTGEFVRGFFTM